MLNTGGGGIIDVKYNVLPLHCKTLRPLMWSMKQTIKDVNVSYDVKKKLGSHSSCGSRALV